MTTEVFVAPVGSSSTAAWTKVGTAREVHFGFDIGPDEDDLVLQPLLRVAYGGEVRMTMHLRRRHAKQWARLFRVPVRYLYRNGPAPLPAAALPLSKRRSRRRWR